jgi:hypothetical protein
MKEDCCEIVTRDKKINKKVKTIDVISAVKELLKP